MQRALDEALAMNIQLETTAKEANNLFAQTHKLLLAATTDKLNLEADLEDANAELQRCQEL